MFIQHVYDSALVENFEQALQQSQNAGSKLSNSENCMSLTGLRAVLWLFEVD